MVHSFRLIRARTVNLILLYSTGSPLRAVVLLKRQICRAFVEVSLFKMEHSQTQRGAMTRSRHGPRRREAAQGAMLNREKGLIPQFSRSILRPSQQLPAPWRWLGHSQGNRGRIDFQPF